MSKILIVEDEESLRKALVDKFQQEKLEVLNAKNGQEGLKMALEEKPDLMLLDILMPKMDGIEMVKELRKDDWGKNVPVIILTNVKDSDKIAQSLEEGITDYVIKSDESINQIVEKIKHKLGS